MSNSSKLLPIRSLCLFGYTCTTGLRLSSNTLGLRPRTSVCQPNQQRLLVFPVVLSLVEHSQATFKTDPSYHVCHVTDLLCWFLFAQSWNDFMYLCFEVLVWHVNIYAAPMVRLTICSNFFVIASK